MSPPFAGQILRQYPCHVPNLGSPETANVVVRRHVRNWNVSGQRDKNKEIRNSDLAVYGDMGESKCAFGAIIHFFDPW